MKDNCSIDNCLIGIMYSTCDVECDPTVNDYYILITLKINTIGNINSKADYANLDMKDLFIILWNVGTKNIYPVLEGRGDSAISDFYENKRILLNICDGTTYNYYIKYKN